MIVAYPFAMDRNNCEGISYTFYGANHLSTTTCVQPPNRQADQIEFSNL
jgi:hypothetical protein